LANLALLDGDFEESIAYSAEAVRYAELSDEYIKGISRLLPTLAEASDRLKWAEASGAAVYYQKEVDKARSDYRQALDERYAHNWEAALEYALLVLAGLADVAAPPPKGAPPRTDLPKKPLQYKVRPWDVFGDCFWNIADWFYGSPWKWTLLYEANKALLPDPDNPNWLEVGTVLDIPAAPGEIREGFWDSGLPYIGE
jgi:nucleoid-associated protein YgaU